MIAAWLQASRGFRRHLLPNSCSKGVVGRVVHDEALGRDAGLTLVQPENPSDRTGGIWLKRVAP
jgi:hypothetical protein